MGIDFLVVHLINHFGLSVGAHLFCLRVPPLHVITYLLVSVSLLAFCLDQTTSSFATWLDAFKGPVSPLFRCRLHYLEASSGVFRMSEHVH